MPRLPIDYSKTIMYKLVCKDLAIKELYVGATTNWSNRQHNHKLNCNNENRDQYHFKVYQFIRKNGGFDNWNMIMVEEYSCDNKLQSDAREHYFTELLGAKLNMNVVGRTPKEWYIENREELIEYQKIYRENHKEDILEKHKKYNETNKIIINEKRKVRYEANKAELNEKITCDCGSVICKQVKARHNKSIKHINYLSTL